MLFSLGNFFLRQFGSRHGIKGPSGVREGAQYSGWKTTSSFTISVEVNGTLTLEPSLAYIIYSSNLVDTKTNFNRLVFSPGQSHLYFEVLTQPTKAVFISY